MSADDLPAWLAAATAADLFWHGIEQLDETPQHALQRLAEEMDVDLNTVAPCLQLLRDGHCILAGGSPLALLSYSPRRGTFKASFDGDLGAYLDGLSATRAGIWLTMLAGEAGSLPSSLDHWLIATLDQGRISSRSDYVAGLAKRYADEMLAGNNLPPEGPMNSLDWFMGRAIWRCAAYRLR